MKVSKINFFDALIVTTFILLSLTFFLVLNKPNNTDQRDVVITLKINYPEQAETIYGEALKDENVYLNSVNTPVKTLKVEKILGKEGQITGLKINFLGKGNLEKKYIFNGQRVLIGQKAEIHGTYFAAAVVDNIEYAK